MPASVRYLGCSDVPLYNIGGTVVVEPMKLKHEPVDYAVAEGLRLTFVVCGRTRTVVPYTRGVYEVKGDRVEEGGSAAKYHSIRVNYQLCRGEYSYLVNFWEDMQQLSCFQGTADYGEVVDLSASGLEGFTMTVAYR